MEGQYYDRRRDEGRPANRADSGGPPRVDTASSYGYSKHLPSYRDDDGGRLPVEDSYTAAPARTTSSTRYHPYERAPSYDSKYDRRDRPREPVDAPRRDRAARDDYRNISPRYDDPPIRPARDADAYGYSADYQPYPSRGARAGYPDGPPAAPPPSRYSSSSYDRATRQPSPVDIYRERPPVDAYERRDRRPRDEYDLPYLPPPTDYAPAYPPGSPIELAPPRPRHPSDAERDPYRRPAPRDLRDPVRDYRDRPAPREDGYRDRPIRDDRAYYSRHDDVPYRPRNVYDDGRVARPPYPRRPPTHALGPTRRAPYDRPPPRDERPRYHRDNDNRGRRDSPHAHSHVASRPHPRPRHEEPRESRDRRPRTSRSKSPRRESRDRSRNASAAPVPADKDKEKAKEIERDAETATEAGKERRLTPEKSEVEKGHEHVHNDVGDDEHVTERKRERDNIDDNHEEGDGGVLGSEAEAADREGDGDADMPAKEGEREMLDREDEREGVNEKDGGALDTEGEKEGAYEKEGGMLGRPEEELVNRRGGDSEGEEDGDRDGDEDMEEKDGSRGRGKERDVIRREDDEDSQSSPRGHKRDGPIGSEEGDDSRGMPAEHSPTASPERERERADDLVDGDADAGDVTLPPETEGEDPEDDIADPMEESADQNDVDVT